MFIRNLFLSVFCILILFVLLYPEKTLKLFWLFLAVFYLNPCLSLIDDFIFSRFFEQAFIGITVTTLAALVSIIEGIVLGIMKKELLLIISSLLVAILLGIGIFDLSIHSMSVMQTIVRILIICLLT